MDTLSTSEFARYTCDIITDSAKMAELEADWNALWLKAKGSFYQSFSLCYHSWKEIAEPAGRSLFCIVIRDKGAMVLVFPMVRYRKGPLLMIRPLGPNAAETTDMLVDPDTDRQAVITRAWRTIERGAKADIIHMPFIKVGSTLDQLVQRRRSFERDAEIAPFADLQDQTDWETYQKIIGTNARQQLNRKRKRLSELGEFAFVEIDPVANPERTAELLEWMFAQKQIWAERAGKDWNMISSQEYRDFLYRWITDPNNIQQMRIYTIEIDKMPIALKLAAYGVSHLDLIIAAFHPDPQYAKYSPGFVLDEFWMKIVFEKRLNVDFGAGSEPYKLFWSRNVKNDLANYRIPDTIAGATATHLWRLKRRVAAHLAERRKRQAAPVPA